MPFHTLRRPHDPPVPPHPTAANNKAKVGGRVALQWTPEALDQLKEARQHHDGKWQAIAAAVPADYPLLLDSDGTVNLGALKNAWRRINHPTAPPQTGQRQARQSSVRQTWTQAEKNALWDHYINGRGTAAARFAAVKRALGLGDEVEWRNLNQVTCMAAHLRKTGEGCVAAYCLYTPPPLPPGWRVAGCMLLVPCVCGTRYSHKPFPRFSLPSLTWSTLVPVQAACGWKHSPRGRDQNRHCVHPRDAKTGRGQPLVGRPRLLRNVRVRGSGCRGHHAATRHAAACRALGAGSQILVA